MVRRVAAYNLRVMNMFKFRDESYRKTYLKDF